MNYWLLKSEPDVFSIDDLADVEREPWDGVRNYQARNFMRDQMQVGDLALFYHSNTRPPGVVGVARIATPAHPDETQFDPQSRYYDPKSSPDNPRWWCPDVSFVLKFPDVVSLQTLRDDPGCAGMLVTRKGQRLSVQPVEPEHFRRVLELAGVDPADVSAAL
ncbi:MAG: EVE domain-containing protein [Candidatus Dadabacteria bacterium]|nr:MAG: EVE domain-containing protein [Candidatus Dadabacteria bacterium]